MSLRNDRPPPSDDETLRTGKAVSLLGAGFSIATSALAGLALGSWLDRNRQAHVFAAAGFLLGLAAGFHRAYLLVRSIVTPRRDAHGKDSRTREKEKGPAVSTGQNPRRGRKL